MMMNTETQIALAALIVSLVALFVTFSQLLQTYLGTAEGYRRCSAAVLGAWHKTRRRPLLPKEGRLETRFSTPEIRLIGPDEYHSIEEQDPEGVCWLHRPGDITTYDRMVRETVHFSSSPSSSSYFPKKLIGLGILGLRQSRNEIRDMERGDSQQHVQGPGTHESEHLVTWIHLLRELHRLYTKYWPDECSGCVHHPLADSQLVSIAQRRLTSWSIAPQAQMTRHIEKNAPLNQGKNSNDEPHENATAIAILYRHWTWDLLPPDVTRPVAKTTLGDIVVLALRMGMEWRTISPESGRMQADGNGHSLTSTNFHGLGTVMRFVSMRHPSFQQNRRRELSFAPLVPTRENDQLLCGIIPGVTQKLVQRDFHMVDNSGKAMKAWYPGGLLTQIGLPDGERDRIRDRHAIHNEVFILLCPFLPLRGSDLAGMRYHFYDEKISAFLFWEGRLCFLRAIQKRNEEISEPGWFKDMIQKILNEYKRLERFQYDFYDNWKRAVINKYPAAKNERMELLEACREAFQAAVSILEDAPLELHTLEHHKFQRTQTRYLHLVAAHACMALNSIEAAFDNFRKLEQKGTDFAQLYDVTACPGYRRSKPWAPRRYEIALEYGRSLRHPNWGIRSFLRRKGLEFSEEEAEIAWHAAVLRSVAWTMSVHWLPWTGNAVPSSLFGITTSVWFT